MARGIAFDFSEPKGSGNEPVETTGRERGSNGSTATGSGINNGGSDVPRTGPVIKRRRGRPALPRDSQGNIIRNGQGTGAGSQTRAETKPDKGTAKESLGVSSGKVVNDRATVSNNIQAMHGVIATLTRQPVMMLSPQEGDAMSKALCDVLDYHNIDLGKAGGPIGLYVTLGMTVYMVEAPRLAAMRQGNMKNVTPPRGEQPASRPATPGDASNGPRPMDFTADMDVPPAEAMIIATQH